MRNLVNRLLQEADQARGCLRKDDAMVFKK
jgi:hypothetical protein